MRIERLACVRLTACMLVALCGSVCFDSISLIGLVRGHESVCVCKLNASFSSTFSAVCPNYSGLFLLSKLELYPSSL